MKVLGVWDGHNATACLSVNGKIDSCASEERFTRVKNQDGLPKQAIKFAMEHGKIKPADLDLVVLASQYIPVVASNPAGTARNSVRKFVAKVRPIEKLAYKTLSGYFYGKRSAERKKAIVELLDIDIKKIIVADHHLLHAYTTYFGSGFGKALVFTLDGEGDGLCASVNIAENGELKRISSTSRDNSLGLLWARTTEYLGMKAVEHEFKVMGLAPYAKDDKAYSILKTLVYLEDGNFKAKIPAREFEQFLKENLYRVRFDSIAYGLQKLTEELVPAWIKYWVDKTGISDIALGGGVFMNVKLNMLLCDTYKNLFVYPSCGDESLALGSCYYGHKYLGESGIEPLGSLYFGPEYSDEQVEAAIKNRGLKFTKHKDIASKIAKLLKSGKIVASFAGRMEWGARALGNRSILADPRKLENIKIINEAIKQRDFWMPFAPAILEERTADYIENPRTAPYMILAFRSTELSRKNLAATMHPYDHTVRPQIVNSKSNARFYKIIKEFEKLTGCGVVLNTSFNLHGYPIVMTPEDALYVFENSGLNYLAMNNYLVEKTA